MFAKYFQEDTGWFIQFLDVKSQLTSLGKTNLAKFKISNRDLLAGYETMVQSRIHDERMMQFQRQGRMLTFVPNIGEEAIGIGTSMCLDKKDWSVPAFRSNTVWLYRGYTMEQMMLYWYGNEEGSIAPKDVNVLPVNVPIATQCSHAAGIAYSLKLKKQPNVAITYIGDGGTSEGEFYELLNFAGVYQLPAIFVINNNQWGISTPSSAQTHAKTFAQKAVACGVPYVRVDGNDLFAIHAVTKRARDRAVKGDGPTLIECLTYRKGPHTTADDPTLYRTDKKYIAAEEAKDPIPRLAKYLISKKIITKKENEAISEKAYAAVDEAFKNIQNHKLYDLRDIFQYTYKKMPPHLEEQYAEAAAFWEKHGKEVK